MKYCECGKPKYRLSNMCIECFHLKGLSKESLESKKRKERECKKHLRKKVCQYSKKKEVLTIWDSISQASRCLRICKSHIIKCCKGKLKTAYGFIWKYETN